MELELIEKFYGEIDKPTAEILREKEHSLAARTSRTIIENGRDLVEAKAACKHGEFVPWVERCLPWSIRSVQDMMQIYDKFKYAHCAYLENIQKSALRLLSPDSVPEEARQEALELAESGEKVTHKIAQELKEKYQKEMEDKDNKIEELDHSLEVQAESFRNLLKRKSDLEAEFKKLQSEIDNRQAETIVSVPEDYEEIKRQNMLAEENIESLKRSIKAMRKRIADDIENGVKQREMERAKDISDAKQAFETFKKSFESLKKTHEELNREVSDLNACNEFVRSVRVALGDMSRAFDLFFDGHIIPKSKMKEVNGLVVQLENGRNTLIEMIERYSELEV